MGGGLVGALLGARAWFIDLHFSSFLLVPLLPVRAPGTDAARAARHGGGLMPRGSSV